MLGRSVHAGCIIRPYTCTSLWYDERAQSSKTRLSQPILRALEPSQLSKLERQRALLQNCGQIINKQQLFIFPNSLTIHQTPPLHNTFYFSNTWTKIQLRSDPVNMQPDETKCYPQRPITTLWPAACKMLSTSSGSPPLNSGTLSLHMERNCRIRRGAAGYWNVTLATTRRQALSCCSQANIRRRTGKMWWLIEICINWVVHWSFDGYHEWSGD